MAEVGQVDLRAQVDALAGFAACQSGQRPAVDVVGFESGVGEGDDLGQETVYTDEARERIPEHVLGLFVQGKEAFHARLHGGVYLFMGALAQDEGGGLLHLARVQDVEFVQCVSGVEQQVGIGGGRHGLAVVDGEGVADVVGVIDEVEDESPGLVGMGPVEA